MDHFKVIKYNRDNYGFILSNNKEAIIVDPGSSGEFLKELNDLELKFILLTHSDWDHKDGLEDIQRIYPASKVIDYKSDSRNLIGYNLEVIQTPGHTSDSCCFYFPDLKIVITGDTLFTGCCGKIRTNYKEMFNSLQKLRDLPGDTEIYPGHEYLNICLPFINNETGINTYYSKRLKVEHPSLGVTINEEIRNNPFLTDDFKRFKELRLKKDKF